MRQLVGGGLGAVVLQQGARRRAHPMIRGLRWRPLAAGTATELLDLLSGGDGAREDARHATGSVATLPFLRHWRLVRLTLPAGTDDTAPGDVFAMWRRGRDPVLLDGSSGPVFTATEDEDLVLATADLPDYLRFFCFAIRGDEGAFTIVESVPAETARRAPEIAALARPLAPMEDGDDGRARYRGTMLYGGTLFEVTLAVTPDGQVEMLDDQPRLEQVDPALVAPLPPLGRPPVIARPGPSGRSGRRRRPTVAIAVADPLTSLADAAAEPETGDQPSPRVVMVELLLERALEGQSRNRLLVVFNATRPAADRLDQLAALVLAASPVVVVETEIPFVEETIGHIISRRLGEAVDLDVCTARVDGPDTPISFALPRRGPALVLMPLQVYSAVADVERFAYELGMRDLSAVIACRRFTGLPESLRRMTDVVLRLPDLDAGLFARLFEDVMRRPLPAGWNVDGAAWVRQVQATDFEHPRRMGLAPEAALTFIREQVAERLAAVDATTGPGLADLEGMGEARAWAQDLIADMHAAIEGRLPWSQVDRGALLVGAPGTGKTTLARAIAKECGVRFIVASATGWQGAGHLGQHIEAIRKTFAEARRYAPSIVFIDEIDSLGNREQFRGDQNAVYQTEVVNAVLEQIQGMDPDEPVIVIGATNHEESVDPALRRAGRLDRVIPIPRPNGPSLAQIYRFHLDALRGSPALGPDVDPAALGRLSVGLTGADVERIVRGAARRARRARRDLCQDDLYAERMNRPRDPSAMTAMRREDLERTAVHEAGHALAQFLGPSAGESIGYVSIIPRDDGTLGFVMTESDDRPHMTRRDYEELLETALGGRAAEEVAFGRDQVTSGAASDLRTATAIAIRMVTRLGLGAADRLLWSEQPTSDDLATAESLLAQAYTRITERLCANRDRHARLAAALVDRQELPGDEVRTILAG